MPSKKSIVKSGNPGKSSKSKKALSASVPQGKKPSPSTGFKYPLGLLHERCQKSGWNKPTVDTHQHSNGWSFAVTLRKLIKDTSQKETVRLEPHLPRLSPTALEAIQCGATYALYQLCRGIPLGCILPPGSQAYWNELAAEHRNSPQHRKWMYDADPFASRQVNAQQPKVAHKREDTDAKTSDPLSDDFSQIPELEMAVPLREVVEDAINKAISQHPEEAFPETDLDGNSDIIPPNQRATGRRRGHLRSDDRDSNQIKRDFESVCRNYKFIEILATRRTLPAFNVKEEFLQRLENNRVLIVVGETGSGKTTQLPQFILDSLILSGRGSEASIIVTQPRRISAISVAARVSAERVDDGSVGYSIRGESKQGRRTKLLFCTTGVVLRRLGSGDELQGVSHIVVDEVHERSVDSDFLLLELKELLTRHRSLKVILMSATINHETFVKYFDGAPLVTISGFAHPITDRYLEDFMPLIRYQTTSPKSRKQSNAVPQAFCDELKSQGLDDSSITAIHNVVRADRVDFKLVAAVVNHIISTADKRGGILIFLPGVHEIRQCIDAMRNLLTTKQADIFPLHANLSNDEQRLVFSKTSDWKIIVATNVAETSITIDDIIYVVDSGKVKEIQHDPDTDLSRLMETRVTQAAARQRRGRAGRTQRGVCYKLYTRKQESNMGRFPVPEILRVPLEKISLTIRAMREDEDVKQYLSRAIDPPKTTAMEKAWSVLEELGAVDKEGKLTPLGRHMSMLPTDPRLAKMLILGALFQCLGPILTIAGSLSSKPLFLNPMDKQNEATQARARFSNAASDLLTDLKAFDECARLRCEGKSRNEVKTFCEENFISLATIREITTLRIDFITSLADLGFVPLSSMPSTPSLNANSTNTNLLKAVIIGGLWPRVAHIHLARPELNKVKAGTIQRENTARKFKIFDMRKGRVFLHPASVLFGATAWKSQILVYFHKYMSTKVFLRDATEVPLYALLLFGGQVSVNHIAGSITITSKETSIKLKACPRIGILVNQLRYLLDVQLERCVEKGIVLDAENDNSISSAILALLSHDGLTE